MKKYLTDSPIASVSTFPQFDSRNFNKFRGSLLNGVHATNKRFGCYLTREDEEDIAGNLMLFFIEKCQQGIYDMSKSTPEQFLLGGKRTWGPVQKLVKLKLSQKQLDSYADDVDDEDGGTIILAPNVDSINQPDIFRSETENQLLKVILEVCDRDRKVIKHLIAGTPREEMALDLGLSLNTLNKLIFDVRKRLRSKLVAKNTPTLAA